MECKYITTKSNIINYLAHLETTKQTHSSSNFANKKVVSVINAKLKIVDRLIRDNNLEAQISPSSRRLVVVNCKFSSGPS